MIQALSLLRMIGLAIIYHNLYLLSQDSCVLDVTNNNVHMKSCNENVSTRFTLLHHRHGHLSYNVINKIKQRFPIVSDFINTIYDCCHYAK